MKRLRVGFDSDGCLDNFGDGVFSALVARGQGHLWKSGPTEASFWNFYEDWGWTFDQFKDLVDWGVDNGYIFTGHWRPNAIEAIGRVARLGHEIIIITDRAWGSDPRNSQKNTVAALAEAGIEYDELIFSKDKTCSPTDMFVEDRLDNYDTLIDAGVDAYLINRPWNQVPGGDARKRINDISEYADIVEAVTAAGFIDYSMV